jgi:hypothetical protein
MLETAMRWFFALLVCGCVDVSGFRGSWQGRPESSPLTLVGMSADTDVSLLLDSVERTRVSGSVNGAPLRPLSQAMADQLGEAALPDNPLRSYWNAVTLDGNDAIALISLYGGDERVDLRLIRSDTLYVVLHLARK